MSRSDWGWPRSAHTGTPPSMFPIGGNQYVTGTLMRDWPKRPGQVLIDQGLVRPEGPGR